MWAAGCRNETSGSTRHNEYPDNSFSQFCMPDTLRWNTKPGIFCNPACIRPPFPVGLAGQTQIPGSAEPFPLLHCIPPFSGCQAVFPGQSLIVMLQIILPFIGFRKRLPRKERTFRLDIRRNLLYNKRIPIGCAPSAEPGPTGVHPQNSPDRNN